MVWLPVCPVTVSGPPAEPWKPLRAFKSKLEIKRAWHAISSRVYWGTCDWPRKLRKTSRVLLGPVFSSNCRSVTWLCHRGNAIILILLSTDVKNSRLFISSHFNSSFANLASLLQCYSNFVLSWLPEKSSYLRLYVMDEITLIQCNLKVICASSEKHHQTMRLWEPWG